MPSRANLANPDAVTAYLAKYAYGNEEIQQYLIAALAGALRRDETWLNPTVEIANDVPEFIRNMWDTNGPWQRFEPDNLLDTQVHHIADSIARAMERNAPWLKDKDAKGRPKALIGIGTTVEAVTRKIDSIIATEHRHKLLDVTDADIEKVMDLKDGDEGNDRNGFTIVKLLTPKALGAEGAMMSHCIGDGNHDTALIEGRITVYSLRDKNGKAHATFEVDPQSNTLTECSGNGNKPPNGKYMPHVLAFIRSQKFNITDHPSHSGIIQVDGEYYDVNHLPEILEVKTGGLDLRQIPRAKLPRIVRIWDGDLDISNSDCNLADIEILEIKRGSVHAEKSATNGFPKKANINGDLVLREVNIRDLSSAGESEVLGQIDLSHNHIERFPDRWKVKGGLDLSYVTAEKPPRILDVDGNFTIYGHSFNLADMESLNVGRNVSGGSGKRETEGFPTRVHIEGDLRYTHSRLSDFTNVEEFSAGGYVDLSNNPQLQALPTGMRVGRDLYIGNTGITESSKGVKLGGSVTHWIDGHYDKSILQTWQVKEWPDGYEMVQVVRPEVLDDDSRILHHTITRASAEADDHLGYYSLRDPNGVPCATLEFNSFDRPPSLVRCKGMNDGPPEEPHLRYAQEFIREKEARLEGKAVDMAYLVQDREDQYHYIRALPEGSDFFSLDLSGISTLGNSDLPQQFKVLDLDVSGTQVTAVPSGAEVNYLICNTPFPRQLQRHNSAFINPLPEEGLDESMIAALEKYRSELRETGLTDNDPEILGRLTADAAKQLSAAVERGEIKDIEDTSAPLTEKLDPASKAHNIAAGITLISHPTKVPRSR